EKRRPKAHDRGAWARLDPLGIRNIPLKQQIQVGFQGWVQPDSRRAPKRLGDPRPHLRLGRLDALTTMAMRQLYILNPLSTNGSILSFFTNMNTCNQVPQQGLNF
ncbi:hypothetical protein Taro_035484, partial [Colocasia esculenta]|nr:hypothetical protein [Colocasia esculenta]